MGRRRCSDLTSIKDVIRASGRSQEWAKVAAAALAQHTWEEVVGPEAAQATRAKAVQNGVLLVTTDHPAWAQELSLRRKELVEEINRRVGARALEDIRFIVGESGEE